MKTKFTLCIVLAGFFASYNASAQVPDRVGWWQFENDVNLGLATVGTDLVLEGDIVQSDGPNGENWAVNVPLGSYLTMAHGIAANGGGTKVNEWSLQIDFKVPAIDTWYAFFETEDIASSDADLFVAKTEATDIGRVPNSIGSGAVRYTENTISADTWYRMVVTVKNGEFFRIYMDGELWLESPIIQDVDGRYALAPTIYIFQDGDGDDGTLDCSDLAIWDRALTADQVAELGDANVVGIKDLGKARLNNDLQQNYPNPAANFTTFNYKVVESGNVSFTIFNAIGQKVQEIEKGNLPIGKYRLDLNTSDLGNGVYYIQLKSNDRISNQKFTISR
jgi:hypothetical protein